MAFNKDFIISVNNNKVVICKNPNSKLETFEDVCDISKRYLYKSGQKILTPFGVETIYTIINDYSTEHGYEWLILVEENNNQYKPIELMGIVIYECDLDNSVIDLREIIQNFLNIKLYESNS